MLLLYIAILLIFSLSIYKSDMSAFICLSVCLSICLSVCLPGCLPVCRLCLSELVLISSLFSFNLFNNF